MLPLTELEFIQHEGGSIMLPMFARAAFALLITQAVVAQQPPSQTLPPTAQSSGRSEQMRADLTQMESLMNNMQSQINFLRDQNLQILLNTNVQMWTILIRDLRRQLDDEQRPSPAPVHPGTPHQ
jgi:hypothetical protein